MLDTIQCLSWRPSCGGPTTTTTFRFSDVKPLAMPHIANGKTPEEATALALAELNQDFAKAKEHKITVQRTANGHNLIVSWAN